MNRATKILKQVWKPLHFCMRNLAYPDSFTQYLENLSDTNYSKLLNGVTIATEERPCDNACIALVLDAGSRYENNHENGMIHFFEHIAFKGTNCRSRNELETQMSSIGAKFRCFTTREMVVYYVECLSEDTPLAVDLLADCVFNNAYAPRVIQSQKEIVYKEMLILDKKPKAVVSDYLHSTAFQGTPLAQSVMGPSCNLNTFTDTTLCKYLSKRLDPCRTVLAAVGKIEHEDMVHLADCFLSKLEPLRCSSKDAYRYTGSDVRFRDDSMPTAHVMVAVEGPCFTHQDNIVMEVARHIVGGWDRSQPGGQGHAVRVARNASGGMFCDSYQAFNITYKDCGLWGVHFVSDVMSLDDMMMLIQNEFMYLCLYVTGPELDRAKNFLKTMILSQMESSLGSCLDIGRWGLYSGCRPSLMQKMSAIDRITVDQMRTVCKRYIYDRCPVVAAVGPTEGLLEYERIRSYMWSVTY